MEDGVDDRPPRQQERGGIELHMEIGKFNECGEVDVDALCECWYDR